MKKNYLIRFSILLAITLIAYIPTFAWMVDRWTATDTYYSHGFLVPLICAFLVWMKRKKLSALPIEASTLGWLLFLPGIAIHTVSAVLRVYFTSGFSLLLVISGLVLLFFGKRFLRELLFSIAFLIFMIPLPLIAIANLSFRLKIFAAQVSAKLINMLGVPAIRDGSVIKTMNSYLVVEDPCSGIRSLIALIALGALMAYFSNLSRVKKTILFASSMPIAICTNIIRIVVLSLGSEMYGAKVATGIVHDVMGVLVFVLAFLGLTLVAKFLE